MKQKLLKCCIWYGGCFAVTAAFGELLQGSKRQKDNLLKIEFCYDSFINMIRFVVLKFLMMLSLCCGDSTKHLEATVTAIEKLVYYYDRNYAGLNLDGIYGLRVIEGQIALILDNYASGQIHNPTPDWVWHRLQKIYQTSHNISEQAINSLQETEPEYYKQMQWIVDRPMKFAKDYRRLDASLRWPSHVKKKGQAMEEEFSDRCIHELMGSEENGYKKCAISKECLTVMLSQGHIEYSITHQVLYTIVAEQNGCLMELEQYLQSHGLAGTVSGFQQDLCTNNFFEVRELVGVLGSHIVTMYQDLFMEQLFVCPILGFMEFLHADWLYQVLSWQKEQGCYGKEEQTRSPSRQLLFEKEAQDGCLSHKTAVAAACISQFLRFLVNPGSAEYQQYAHMDGRNHVTADPVLIGGGGKQTRDNEAGEEPAVSLLHDGQLQEARAAAEQEEAEEEHAQLRRQEIQEAMDSQDNNNGGDDAEEHVMLRGGQLNRLEDDDDGEDDEEDEEEEEDDEDQDVPQYDMYNGNKDNMDSLHRAPVLVPQQHQQAVDDREYKQYIDDDSEAEQRDEDEEKAKLVVKHLNNNNNINEPVVKEVNDDGYNYYEDSKAQKLDFLTLEKPSPHLGLPDGSGGSMFTSYAIMLGAMVVVLLIMYRFIRKRRVLIRYRYSK